jgi:hypothetical protein
VPDTGDDDDAEAIEIAGSRGALHVEADVLQGLFHRAEIAGAVVDHDRFHSSPFVDGNFRSRRLSREHAIRRARANALNTASTL